MNHDFLACIFPNKTIPTIVYDTNLVGQIFSSQGFRVMTVQQALATPPLSALIISTKPTSLPLDSSIHDIFSGSAVLDIPLNSFETSEKAIFYLLERLSKINFQDACRRSLAIVEKLEFLNAPITIQTPNSNLQVSVGKNIDVAMPKLEPMILQGEWVSIAQYLEIGLVPNQDYSSFDVSGSLVCDGTSVAHHRANYEIAQPKAEAAWQIFKNIRVTGNYPIEINIKNSKVTSIKTASGLEVLDRILPLTDEVFFGHLIEVSFASLPSSKNTNWLINSQINEASGGFHCALGTGVDAAHIDFIASDATVIWP